RVPARARVSTSLSPSKRSSADLIDDSLYPNSAASFRLETDRHPDTELVKSRSRTAEYAVCADGSCMSRFLLLDHQKVYWCTRSHASEFLTPLRRKDAT